MTKVLFLSDKTIGRQMSGPGLRAFELAGALRGGHDVSVASRETSTWRKIFLVWVSQVVVVQIFFLSFLFILLARLQGKRIVIDAYSPFHLEHVEIDGSDRARSALMQKITDCRIRFLFACGDFFLCASERQKELWLPWLESVGKEGKRLAVVPTGIRAEPPHQSKHLLKGGIPGISAGDKVVLWSSGIWPWLDSLTAIEAIALVKDERVKLVFFGLAAIDLSLKGEKQPQLRAAVALARDKGLLDKRVFFVSQRTPYDEMGDYLLDADIALNLHFDTPETRYAYRGRLLDYIWANIPVITTKGDVLSELISRRQAGLVVDYRAAGQIAAAIERLASDRHFHARCRQNLKELAGGLVWSKAARPLADYCRLTEPPGRRASWRRLLPLLAGIYWFSALYLLRYIILRRR